MAVEVAVFPALASVAAACALGLPPPGDVDVTWHPAQGARVEKTFALDTDLRSGQVTWRYDDGQPGYLPEPGWRLGFEMYEQRVFVDEVRALTAGRPLKLARTFEAIEARDVSTGEGWGDDQRQEIRLATDLTDRTVLFSWDEVGEQWRRSFVDDEQAPPDLLAGLEEDIDFRAFVPAKPIAAGVWWEIEPQAFRLLFAPGGDVALHPPAGSTAAPNDGRWLERSIAEHLEGRGWGQVLPSSERAGPECATIHVEAHLTVDIARERAQERTLSAKGEITIDGEILWDLAAHRAHSAELSIDLEVRVRIDSLGPALFRIRLSQEFDLAGRRTLRARFEER